MSGSPPWETDAADGLVIRPVGRVESSLVDLASAPRQGDEGAPSAWLVLDPSIAAAAADLATGSEVLVLTWLDRADRTTLAVQPRGDMTRAHHGVFSTRSPDRPNPIGLHRVRIIAKDVDRIEVDHLEAINGTPIVDIKPLLGPVDER